MALLKSLYVRSVGDDLSVNYDSILDRFRCISYEASGIVESRLFSCSFARKSKNGHILASTCENGEVIISDTKLLRLGSSDYYQISKAHNNAIYSIAWSDIDMKLVTTSGDNSARLWDVNDDGKLELLDTFLYHRQSVRTACFKQQNCNVFATGGYDGNIFVWDTRTVNRTPDQQIYNCHGDGTITCLAFQDEFKVISCGNKDTNIKVWDLRKTYVGTSKKSKPLYLIPSPKKTSGRGYSNVIINKNATRLYARCFDHIIYCFNIVNYSPVPDSTYLGHVTTGPYDRLSFSPDEKYLASTDSYDNKDSKVFVWKTNFPERPRLKFGAEQLRGLSDVSWCPEDELVLATSSDDPLPCIWSIPPTNDAEQFERDGNILMPIDSQSQSPKKNNIPLSYIERCHIKSGVDKRVSAMAKSFRHVRKSNSKLHTLPTLPNGFQIHECIPIEKRKQNHWLTNNMEVKKLNVQKPQRKTGIKRKSCGPMSPGNNLYQYFKRSKETLTLLSKNKSM